MYWIAGLNTMIMIEDGWAIHDSSYEHLILPSCQRSHEDFIFHPQLTICQNLYSVIQSTALRHIHHTVSTMNYQRLVHQE